MDEVCSAAGFTLGVTRQTCKYPSPGLSFLFNTDLPSQRVKRSRSDPGAHTLTLLKCRREMVCNNFFNNLRILQLEFLIEKGRNKAARGAGWSFDLG